MLISASGPIYSEFFLLTLGDSCYYLVDHGQGLSLFDCGLSAHTRQALGIQEITLDTIRHNRAFIVWGQGPTSRSCWADYYAYLIDGEPFYLSEDSKYVLSGVWIHDND